MAVQPQRCTTVSSATGEATKPMTTEFGASRKLYEKVPTLSKIKSITNLGQNMINQIEREADLYSSHRCGKQLANGLIFLIGIHFIVFIIMHMSMLIT